MTRLLSIIALLFALLVIASSSPVQAGSTPASVGDPSGAVKAGTSPDAWFNGAKQSNWTETDKISPGMAQILSQALIDFGSYKPNGVCESAAANQAWQALADAANGGYLEAFIDAIKSALGGIKKVATFGADPSDAADAIEAGKLADQAFEEAKSRGSDWLKEKLKEIFKGTPPEVVKRTTKRGDCDLTLIAIWDKASQSYEITIYGDCHCTTVRLWDGTHSTKLKSFAVQLKGTVTPDIVDGERVLHVGFAKVTVTANCGCNVGGVTGQRPGGTTTTPGGTTPGGGTTTTPPNTAEGWRKVKTDCKPCQPIVDAIQAAQDARDGMTSEFRDAKAELDAAASRGDKAEIAAAQAKLDALTGREAGLIKLQQELYAKLKACEKEKCPPPGTVPPPTPASGQPLDKDPNLQPVPPGQNKAGSSGVSLPPWAGAGSTVVINVNPNDEAEGGANGVVLITEDQQGHKKLLQGKGNAGRIALLAGLAYGTLRAIELVTGFDEAGKPIVGSTCQIGDPAHIEGTEPLAEVPSPGKLAIREAGSSVQPGDTMTLHVQGNDPLSTRFALDGKPVKLLGVSNNSAVVQFDPSTSLAHHQLVMLSNNDQTPPLNIVFVKLTPHALRVSHPGVTQTVTVEVAGLTPSDGATMYFKLDGDAADMVSGGNAATVPVTHGKAEVQIIGKHAGQILLRFRLDVHNPQFAPAQ